jgi:hypothetical protein
MLVNAKTGKCLTIAGGVSTSNNVDALQFDCDSDPSRRWRISDMTGSGVYQIKNVQTNKCLTIAGGVSTDNNVTALQFDCDSDPSRTWRISDVTGSGVYQIRNVQTNKCLTIAGGVSTDNNVRAVPVHLRHRSVASLDDQAEAVGMATVSVDQVGRRCRHSGRNR